MCADRDVHARHRRVRNTRRSGAGRDVAAAILERPGSIGAALTPRPGLPRPIPPAPGARSIRDAWRRDASQRHGTETGARARARSPAGFRSLARDSGDSHAALLRGRSRMRNGSHRCGDTITWSVRYRRDLDPAGASIDGTRGLRLRRGLHDRTVAAVDDRFLSLRGHFMAALLTAAGSRGGGRINGRSPARCWRSPGTFLPCWPMHLVPSAQGGGTTTLSGAAQDARRRGWHGRCCGDPCRPSR